MKGKIYTTEKCGCGGRFVYDENRNGLFCQCGAMATKGFYVCFGREIQKRFTHDFYGAQRFLVGLRYESDQGKFDPRDYRASMPLGFENLAKQWLEMKKKRVGYYTWYNYKAHVERCIEHFGQRNIKTIKEGHIDDFIFGAEGISEKTRHDLKGVLRQIFRWVCRRETAIKMPDFPDVGYESAYKDVVSLETQSQIIAEIKKIVLDLKIWWGIKILSENPNVRPGELRSIRWGDIRDGMILIKKTKERSKTKGKYIILEPEDIAFIRSLPRAFPDAYFFTHSTGSQRGKVYGRQHFNKYWKAACNKIGLVGVTLYAGTKHSTVTAVSMELSPEEVRRGGTGHSATSSFDRYLVPNIRERLKFREALRGLKVVKLRKDRTG